VIGQPVDSVGAEQGTGPLLRPHERGGENCAILYHLVRPHLDVRLDHRLGPDDAMIADHRPLRQKCAPHDDAFRADDVLEQPHPLVNRRPGPHDRRLEHGPFLDDAPVAEHHVLRGDTALHDAVPSDHHVLQLGCEVDPGVFPDPHVSASRLLPLELDPRLSGENVQVDVQVFVQVPHVLPVPIRDVPEEPVPPRQHLREDVPAPVEALLRRDEGEHLRFQDVDAGVHRIGEDFPPRRLFEETGDPSVLLRNDDSVLERVGDPGEHDRGGGFSLPVEFDRPGEVDIGDDVGADDQEGVVDPRLGVLDGSRRPVIGLRAHIVDLDVPEGSVPKIGGNFLGVEIQEDFQVDDPGALEKPYHVFHHRPVGHVRHRLGQFFGIGRSLVPNPPAITTPFIPTGLLTVICGSQQTKELGHSEIPE